MTKRLYRSKSDRMIAGICGGLADFTSTDATLWRVGMVLLVFLSGGVVVLAYLVCIFVIPEDPVTVVKASKNSKG